MKLIILAILGLVASGCSSSSKDSWPNETEGLGVSECIILTDEVQMSSGEVCTLSEENVAQYSVSPGEVECDAGILTFGGSEFNSATDGVNFGGLTIYCAGGHSDFACDGKEVCSEMTSCAEATYYLLNCPNVRIDGDNDGRPCETQWCN